MTSTGFGRSMTLARRFSTKTSSGYTLRAPRAGAPELLPLFVLCLDAGLRASEAKALRRSDLSLEWQEGVIARGELIVAKSKTEAGTGRKIPLTRRACSLLTLWLSRTSSDSRERFRLSEPSDRFRGRCSRPSHLRGRFPTTTKRVKVCMVHCAWAERAAVPMARSAPHVHHTASRECEQQ
jgi:integrase